MRFPNILIIIFLVVFSLGFFSVSAVQAETWQCECNSVPSPANNPAQYTSFNQCKNGEANISSCATICGSQQTVVCKKINSISSTGCSKDKEPCLQDPLGGKRSIPQIIGGAIKVGLGIIGAIALAMFVYGGFMWMTAGGASDRVKKGRDILVWATIGLAVVFTSYAILQFIIDALTKT